VSISGKVIHHKKKKEKKKTASFLAFSLPCLLCSGSKLRGPHLQQVPVPRKLTIYRRQQITLAPRHYRA
jgi:hypothetical protein